MLSLVVLMTFENWDTLRQRLWPKRSTSAFTCNIKLSNRPLYSFYFALSGATLGTGIDQCSCSTAPVIQQRFTEQLASRRLLPLSASTSFSLGLLTLQRLHDRSGLAHGFSRHLKTASTTTAPAASGQPLGCNWVMCLEYPLLSVIVTPIRPLRALSLRRYI